MSTPRGLTAASPDWSAITDTIACPLCEYNLRGLSEPRCPECGYRFEWHELLDAQIGKHPYLFEHHPERNLWSFFRTAIGTLRPIRFWSSLRPTQISRPRRLLAYWLIGGVIYVLGCITSPAIAIAYLLWNPLPPQFGGVLINWEAIAEAISPFLLPLCWPWLTIMSLMIFRISMKRARVKTVHVLRCVLYSFDAYLWLGMMLVSSGVGEWLLRPPTRMWRDTLEVGFPLLCAAAGIVRLIIAYRLYLRFDRPIATILASQIIVAQIMLIVALVLFEDTFGIWVYESLQM